MVESTVLFLITSSTRRTIEVKTPGCRNAACSKSASVIRYGYYKTKAGRRRRYRCTACGKTFCSTRGTAYHRLQHRRSTFDDVASLSVEGLSKSAIARVMGLACNTVDRWLEKAAACCRRFNQVHTCDLDIRELQVDEVRAFAGRKDQATWIFTTIDVWSRFWPASLVGRRSYKNTRSVLRAVRDQMLRGRTVLVASDGFDYYPRVAREVFGPMCLLGQVLKARRNDRITTVERRQTVGTPEQFAEALATSEDSATLNTSFVERLNLTIRQGSAYLTRRSLAHCRWQARLDDHIELLRCHYNFSRRQRSLKFGREIRTPAMQAGLMSTGLSLRDIFSSGFVVLSSRTQVAQVFAFRTCERARLAA